jgi:drug/metabolite transporter (DMT)-like permease
MSALKHQSLSARALALALALSAFWGGNPVAIKVGLMDAPPLRLGWMRFVLGGLVVFAHARFRRESLRVEKDERGALLGLGILFAAQLALLNLGQDRTSSGHAAVIISAYPLWTALFAHFFVPGDRLTPPRSLGALIAYAGVVAVFSASVRGSSSVSLSGDLLLAISSVLLGARQIVLSRSAQRISIDKLLLAQAGVGTSSFIFASSLFEPEATNWTPRLAIALLYQGVLIAGVAFLFQTWLLKNYPPSRVTNVYLTQPMFGVLFSWAILGEPVGPELFLGAFLVIAGSFLVQRRS